MSSLLCGSMEGIVVWVWTPKIDTLPEPFFFCLSTTGQIALKGTSNYLAEFETTLKLPLKFF